MNNQTFQDLFDEVHEQEELTLFKKAFEYSKDDDRLHNFTVSAGITGLSPEATAWGFLAKQLASVKDFCDGRKPTREMLREKIGDCRNYLVLIEAILIERDGQK